MRGLLLLPALVLTLTAPAAADHAWMPALLTIDADSLRRITAEGRAVAVIDVRSAEAFRGGRLPGAHSIPLPTLIPRHGEVPGGPIVVLYGASGLDDAATAYRYLRSVGHTNVFVLEGGFSGWQARGYAIER
jgi:rhodanese-related sulfurtransferase